MSNPSAMHERRLAVLVRHLEPNEVIDTLFDEFRAMYQNQLPAGVVDYESKPNEFIKVLIKKLSHIPQARGIEKRDAIFELLELLFHNEWIFSTYMSKKFQRAIFAKVILWYIGTSRTDEYRHWATGLKRYVDRWVADEVEFLNSAYIVDNEFCLRGKSEQNEILQSILAPEFANWRV